MRLSGGEVAELGVFAAARGPESAPNACWRVANERLCGDGAEKRTKLSHLFVLVSTDAHPRDRERQDKEFQKSKAMCHRQTGKG